MLTDEPKREFMSSTFKIWVAAFIFLFLVLQLYNHIFFPREVILPTGIILGVVLALISYLWFQELRDRNSLFALNQKLIEAQIQMESAEVDTIAALILTEEAKDPYMRGHSRRVAHCALEINKKMGFPENDQRIMERASRLHDLGKLCIDDNILRKPGKLSDEEWAIIKTHPRKAVEILEPLKFLHKEKEIILHHHERFDGKGYPDGLQGDEIPIESRILAVADTFDAMNSERPYRKPLSKDFILSELSKVSGAQLDSSAVDAFLKLLEEQPMLWDRG